MLGVLVAYALFLAARVVLMRGYLDPLIARIAPLLSERRAMRQGFKG
jgi:hypothetical protein